ncbi:YoaK family protein [Rhodopseudomonas telluris]|uniref:YoaK family protein n=1 Tax=Rhodopseudomonas telluris TaxID=644215 RepID=A0ABV6EM43_9BRAD
MTEAGPNARVRAGSAQVPLRDARRSESAPALGKLRQADAERPVATTMDGGVDTRPNLSFIFAPLLTSTAGFLDAVGYTHLAGLYVSFMSGNSARLGLAIAEGDRQLLLACVLVISSFVAGAFAGSLVSDPAGRFKLTAILAMEIVLLLVAIALSRWSSSHAVMFPVCMAMGLQNAAHETVAGVEVGKSFITGFVFNFGKALAQLARGRGGVTLALAYGMSWAAFVGGVSLGSLALRHFGLTGAMSVAVGVLIAVAIGATLNQFDSPNPIDHSPRRSTSP